MLSQAQAAGNNLFEHLKVLEKDILYFAKHKNNEEQPDRQLISNLMKQVTKVKQRTLHEQLIQLLQGLVGTDKELLNLTNLRSEQLPQLKLQLYQYLIKATRLQQMQRALKKLEQIEKLGTNDTDLSMRIEELSFELSRKRAYQLHHPHRDEEHPIVPGRFIAGYLLFEYASNMMIWGNQLQQLQKQLLAHFSHNNICTEQPTGTGKTAVSGPIVSELLSNRKFVVWNIFTDDLAFENISYMTRIIRATSGKMCHGIEVNRDNPLQATQLDNLYFSMQSALQHGDNYNGPKRIPQSLELRFIEELLNYSLSNGEKPEQKATLLSYAETLDFIDKHVCANLDELHKHSKRNDELNYPLGNADSKKKLKESYRRVSQHFTHFLCHPELKRFHNIRDKLQPKLKETVYNNHIKLNLQP